MARKTKFTKERIEIFLGLIKEGYSVTDSCRGIGIARSTFYKWTDEYPDLNKAVCEATDLQWKYGYDVLRRRKKSEAMHGNSTVHQKTTKALAICRLRLGRLFDFFYDKV